MEPTVPPWVTRTHWRRMHRIRLDSHPRNNFWHMPRLGLYNGPYLPPEDQHATGRHIIRLEEGPPSRVLFNTPPHPWLQHQGPLDTEPWRLPMPPPPPPPPDFKKGDLPDPYIPDSPPPPHLPPPPVHHGVWNDTTMGWVAGTVLLAVFIFIVRSIEKCLDRRLFKARRRQSDEWPTPNVLATSHQHTAQDPPTEPELQIDSPPPYSECVLPKPQCEDPPPPYSVCYVAFNNPKDGVPSAHIMMPERADAIVANDGENGTNTDIAANAGSQVNTTLDDANTRITSFNVIVERNIGVVGANIRTRSKENINENASEVGNTGAVVADIGDIEANANNRAETVGVHIRANASNGNTSDSVILN